jgi:5S rRNA maturation endonuclease (ribonuclease M5)
LFTDYAKKITYSFVNFILEYCKIDYHTLCDWIQKDYQNVHTVIPNKTIHVEVPFDLFISKRPYLKLDLDFWSISDLNITEEILTKYKIFPLKAFSLKGYEGIVKEPTYIFEHSFQQLYQPNLEKHKGRYRAKTSKGVYGWDYLINHDKVIITKSFSDWFYLKLLGFNALHVLTEGNKFTEEDINKLSQFKQVFILYDNDETGIEMANKLKVYGYIPVFYKQEKDTKDMLKRFKSIDVIKTIKSLMQ